MRKIKFQNDYYYHVYNRGVDKRDIFSNDFDYARFLTGMKEFNNTENCISLFHLNRKRDSKEKVETGCLLERNPVSTFSEPLVEIITYCLNPNHYHFLVKQLVDGGISKFMHKLGLGYTKYFNEKNNRSGSLFQGPYKAVEIDSDSYLWYLSAYINGNPEIHKIAKADKYNYSSYKDYLGKRKGAIGNKKVILEKFDSVDEYNNYTKMIIEESGKRKDEIKKYLLD